MSKTFKILYDSYFPFIGFPIGMGVVWLLFDMPINIGALLGINLGYIYGFFNYRFSYIDKICIENDILHIVSINRFLQKNSGPSFCWDHGLSVFVKLKYTNES